MFRTNSQKSSNDIQKTTCPLLFQNTNFSINKHSSNSTNTDLKTRLSNKHISSEKRKNDLNETNSHHSRNVKNNLWSQTTEKRLFSLLDINDRITNSKGPNFPEQYTRKSTQDYEKLLGAAFSAQLLKKNKHIIRFFNCKRPSFNKQQENLKDNNNDEGNISDITKAQSRFNDYQSNSKPLVNSDAPKKKKVVSCQDIFNNPNDKSKFNNGSMEVIRAKSIASDIFFRKGTADNDYKFKVLQYPDFQYSDIFLLKEPEENKSKTIDHKESYYNNARESKSEWHTKNSIPTLLNYSSTDFNIITNKGQPLPKSKKGIEDECQRIGATLNPVHRQKSLSEYIDLTRVSNPNSNQDYLKHYNEHTKPFNRVTNLCSAHLDNHLGYSNLCELPFVKKKF